MTEREAHSIERPADWLKAKGISYNVRRAYHSSDYVAEHDIRMGFGQTKPEALRALIYELTKHGVIIC